MRSGQVLQDGGSAESSKIGPEAACREGFGRYFADIGNGSAERASRLLEHPAAHRASGKSDLGQMRSKI